MRRLMSGCAVLSMVFGTLGVLGAQTASAAPTAAVAAASPSMRADFNGDGFADLAVGSLRQADENNHLDHRGAVNVIYGSASGLSARGNQYWTQDSTSIIGTADIGDAFGSSMASGG